MAAGSWFLGCGCKLLDIEVVVFGVTFEWQLGKPNKECDYMT